MTSDTEKTTVAQSYRLECARLKIHGHGTVEMQVRVIPDREARGRSLMGQGKKFSPRRDSVRELLTERERDI